MIKSKARDQKLRIETLKSILTLAFFIASQMALAISFSASADNQHVTTSLIQIDSSLSDMIADPLRPYLYISDYDNNSVKIISTITDNIVKEILVGSHPTGLDISSDSSELYVAISGGSEIAVVNLSTQMLDRLIHLSASPYDVAAGRLGRLYVTTTEYWGYPRIVDTINNSEIGNISAGRSIYKKAIVEASSDGNTLFIGETGLSPASVLKFDVSTDFPTMVLKNEHGAIGSNLMDMEVSPDGSRIYLACGSPYYIQILNTSDFTSVGQLETGPYPSAITLAADGKIAYASHSNYIHVFNTSTFLQENLYSAQGDVGKLEVSYTHGTKLYAFIGDDVGVITIAEPAEPVWPAPWTILITIITIAVVVAIIFVLLRLV